MKIIINIVLAILLQSIAFSQPKIQINNGKNLDLGTMISGDKIDKKVTIKNIGTDTLIINEVKAGCGCTAALISESKIPPGKEGFLTIGFNSQGFQGKQHKSVTITSNDTTNSPLVFTFSADITMLLKFEPQFIYFQNLAADSTASTKITIQNTTMEAIEITSIQTKVKGLKTQIMQKKLMPNGITELSAVYKAEGDGMIQGEITLNTNNKKQPQIPLKFFAYIKGNQKQ